MNFGNPSSIWEHCDLIIGMVLALFLLQIIESGFNILGISPYLTMALWGTLLLCFIQARGMLGLDRVV